MAGRRLVDLAGLLRASRGVASHHLELRKQQFESYRRTSSLWKILEYQNEESCQDQRTNKIPARKTNGSNFYYSTTSKTSTKNTSIPNPKSVAESNSSSARRDSVEQDHFYEKSDKNTTANPVPGSALPVEQEKAKQSPFPDGSIPPLHKTSADPNVTISQQPSTHDIAEGETAKAAQRQAESPIPSQEAEPPPDSSRQVHDSPNDAEIRVDQEKDVFYSPSADASPVLSSLPRIKVPKVFANVQEGDEHVIERELNQDVFYASHPSSGEPSSPAAQAVPMQEPTDGMYSELFHSPKVAKMLRREPGTHSSVSDIKLQRLKEANQTQRKQPSSADQETFPTRSGASEAGDTPRLGSDIAKETRNLPVEDTVGGSSIIEVTVTDELTAFR